jgi:hypothetical protein
MAHRLPVVLLACVGLVTPADAARIGLLCMAPTLPADAGRPISELTGIEFYLDGGNPLTAYTVPLVRMATSTDDEGHTVIAYSVAGAKTVGASIVFAAETPLTFTLAEIGKTLNTLGSDAGETASMADAIPGIACWKVELEILP